MMRVRFKVPTTLVGCLLFVASSTILLAQSQWKAGDIVSVIKEGAQFGMRDQPLTGIPAGTQLHVTETRGKWIGGYIHVDGQKQLGWLHQSEVTLASLAPRTPLPELPDDPAAVSALREMGARFEMSDRGLVQGLAAGEQGIRDEDLVHLRGLPNLLTIDLSGQPISDVGLRHLATCRALQKLYLDRTMVTDEGLKLLGPLSRIEVLVLANTKVTGAGASELRALPGLQVLNLGGCHVTDDDLSRLAEIHALEILTLPHTKVTDAGLEHLASLRRLRVLNLDGTEVRGTGFDYLIGLTELRMLYVRDCTVEPGAIDALDDKLPGLAIYD